MKRVLKKAIAFVSAIAVAASMAVSASAASASKRIVKDGGYKQVLSTDDGVFFMNFTGEDLENSGKAKTVICVTPDGKKSKVKIETKDNVTGFGFMNSRAVYSDIYMPGFIDYSFYSNGATHYSSSDDEHELIFSSGKTVYVSAEEEISNVNYGEYVVVIDSIGDGYTNRYLTANYNVYDGKGNKLVSVPYSALNGADGSFVKVAAFDKKTKTVVFIGMYDSEIENNPVWLVRNNKTVGKFNARDYGIEFVKNNKGKTAVKTYSNLDTYDVVYYSTENGKKIGKFVEADKTESSKYSVKLKGKNYSVVNKAGKELYSIAGKKVAGYHIYSNSVAIITKSGSKYGLVIVK